MKVLFLTQTTDAGASARFRVYYYLDRLACAGIEYVVAPAVSDEALQSYYRGGWLSKANYYASQFARRIPDVLSARRFDVVFLQRTIPLHVYPFIEETIKRQNPNVIFDFDDAIYAYPSGINPSLLFRLLWYEGDIARIIRLSKHVIVGNRFLADYARRFSQHVTVIPTSIKTDACVPKTVRARESHAPTIVGWIGSQGTLHYLQGLSRVMARLAERRRIAVSVVGARGLQIPGVEVMEKDWQLSTEVEDIQRFDIGVMPLTDDEWSRGKCGTKILQCMAAGVPVVASPVGVNKDIVRDGLNGFLASTEDEWIEKLGQLVDDPALQQRFACEGRTTVEREYSVEVSFQKLLRVFRQVGAS